MYLTSPYLGQITYKIQYQNAKFQTCFGLKLRVKGGSNNLIFSIGFQNLVLSNGSEQVRNVTNGIKIVFFFKKMTENRPAAGSFAPRPPSMICLHLLTQDVSQFRHFHFLTFGLSSFLSEKSWLSIKTGHNF